MQGLVGAGDVAEEAAQALSNVQAQLEAAGSGLDRVVKTTCYLASIKDYAAFNAVYGTFFGRGGKAGVDAPARACFQVGALPAGALVEIECVATAAMC